MIDELLRMDFDYAGIQKAHATGQPLHFLASELMAVIERGVPTDVVLSLSTAKKATITITVE